MIVNQLLPLLLAGWTALAPAGEVHQVRIAPSGEETEITIQASGELEVKDFLLTDPVRLIVDIEGARHDLPRYTYEGISRGGVLRMRTSQFRDGVVRLVFDLRTARQYRITRSGDRIHVRFANPAGAFRPWSSGEGRLASTTVRDNGSPLASSRSADRDDAYAGAGGGDPASVREEGIHPTRSAQQSGQPRISVAYEQANMLDVLAGFSEFAGVSIVPSSNVGDITVRGVEIRDKPWDVALDAILQSHGLGWKRLESGIILVDAIQAIRSRDTLQTETRVFRVNYADASDVAAAVQNVASGQANVTSYAGTNSIIVTDVPQAVSRMDSLVSVLDRRTPQVSIEAKIVFVDRTDVLDLGISYELRDDDLAASTFSLGKGSAPPITGTVNNPIVDVGGGAVAAIANANAVVAQSALEIMAGIAVGDFNIFAFIDALREERLSDLQAAPTIQVMDNESAEIQVGEDVPIRVLEAGAQTEQAQATVRFEQTGIILSVTPHVTNNNQVVLDISAENSNLLSQRQNVGFSIQRQRGQSRVLVDNGETAVIGGLTQSQVTTNRTGIPILMDLPLVGGLFRRTFRTEDKEDLIILVTPHVVTPTAGGSSSSPMSSAEAGGGGNLSG